MLKKWNRRVNVHPFNLKFYVTQTNNLLSMLSVQEISEKFSVRKSIPLLFCVLNIVLEVVHFIKILIPSRLPTLCLTSRTRIQLRATTA